jgi:cation diffusion facilitator CzcD-associated flavoprotein CzcO
MNNYRWPDIKGLEDFAGPRLHSARWDAKLDYKGKSVLVIGAGASAVQIVPTMQPDVSKITIFQRSPAWILKKRMPVYYTAEEIQKFESDRKYLDEYRNMMWDQLESMYPAWVNGSQAQTMMNEMVKAEYEERIKDPELRKKLTPDFRVGCRRVTPSDTYLEAIQAENAEIVFEKISHITKEGIVTVDGKEHKADILVCATGGSMYNCSRSEAGFSV